MRILPTRGKLHLVLDEHYLDRETSWGKHRRLSDNHSRGQLFDSHQFALISVAEIVSL